MCKIYEGLKILFNVCCVSKFGSLVKGDAFYGMASLTQELYNNAANLIGLFAFDTSGDKEAAFPVYQSSNYRLALRAYDRIAFPMAASQAILRFVRASID